MTSPLLSTSTWCFDFVRQHRKSISRTRQPADGVQVWGEHDWPIRSTHEEERTREAKKKKTPETTCNCRGSLGDESNQSSAHSSFTLNLSPTPALARAGGDIYDSYCLRVCERAGACVCVCVFVERTILFLSVGIAIFSFVRNSGATAAGYLPEQAPRSRATVL